jgi:predicted  nucleic acid-binding Zn-ribbon protein
MADEHVLTEGLRQMESLARLTQQNITALSERVDSMGVKQETTLERMEARETALLAREEIVNQQIADLQTQIDRLMNIAAAFALYYRAQTGQPIT